MNDLPLSRPAQFGPGPQRSQPGQPHRAPGWVAAGVLIAATAASLVPAGLVVVLLARHHGADWQANQAGHMAAAKLTLLMIVGVAAGAALGGLITLRSSRRRPVAGAERVAAMAAGAFLTTLAVTAGGALWLLSHAQFTF